MTSPMTLTDEPKLRECHLPRRVGFGIRTIQRRLLTGEFPKPDYYETSGKRRWGVWFGSTIETYLRGKLGR